MPSEHRGRWAGIVLVLLSAAAFGSGSLFAQPVYGSGVDWLVLSSWRFVFGASLAWIWLLASPERRLGLRAMDRRGVLVALGLGVLYVGNSGTYYAGLETVSPSLAALIVYIYPAVVAVLTLRIGRRLEGRRAWGALGIALVGVVLAIGGIEADAMPPISGLLLVLVSPLIYSVWIVLAAKLSGERTRDGRPGQRRRGRRGDGDRADDDRDRGGVLGLGPGRRPAGPAGRDPVGGLGRADRRGRRVSTFIAIQTFYAGTRRIGAAQAALISTVEPFYTITLAALLFGIALTPVQLLGGVLIIVGVVIAQTGPGAAARPMPEVRVADE